MNNRCSPSDDEGLCFDYIVREPRGPTRVQSRSLLQAESIISKQIVHFVNGCLFFLFVFR